MKTSFQGRPVEIERVESHSGDPVDAFIVSAYFLDRDQENLTDAQCEDLQKTASDRAQEMWAEHLVDRAEWRVSLALDL